MQTSDFNDRSAHQFETMTTENEQNVLLQLTIVSGFYGG